MMQNYIITWVYCDLQTEESSYTQMGSNSSETSFQEIYWKCAYVFFKTSIVNNPSAKHLLFTNNQDIPFIEGVSLKDKFASMNVEVIEIPLTFNTPPDYFFSWRNQFYLFDILAYLGRHLEPDDNVIVLDSDCIFTKPAEPIFKDLVRYPALVYSLPFTEYEDIHGLSRMQMLDVYNTISDSDYAEYPTYYGGEWFAAKVSYIRLLNSMIPNIWLKNMNLHLQGKLKFNEEAHMLSFLYDESHAELGSANSYIRRMWTISSIRRDIQNTDTELIIWHCPSEKKYGISALFYSLWQDENNLMTEEAQLHLTTHLGKYFGIPNEQERNNSTDQGVLKQMESIQRIQGPIAIFGSGSYGVSVLNILHDFNIFPYAFIDNDSKRWGTLVESIPVISLNEMEDNTFILIASYASTEIEKQLLHHGLSKDHQFMTYTFYNN